MCQRFQRTSLASDGFAVDAIQLNGERVQIQLRSNAPGSVRIAVVKATGFRAGIYVGPQTCRLAAEALS